MNAMLMYRRIVKLTPGFPFRHLDPNSETIFCLTQPKFSSNKANFLHNSNYRKFVVVEFQTAKIHWKMQMEQGKKSFQKQLASDAYHCIAEIQLKVNLTWLQS